jgi:hypothetical protein
MGDIAQRGNRLTNKHISKDLVRNVYEHVAPKHSPGQKGKPHSSKEGRTASIGRTVRDTMKILTGADRVKKFGGGRTNLLEELGRVEAEPSNRNRRAEISRVHGELNRGYKTGGRVGLKKGGKPWGTGPKPGTLEFLQHHTQTPKRKGKAIGGAVRTLGRALKGRKGKRKDFKTHGKDVPTMAAEGGRIGLKKGGSDKKWIQKAVDPKHKGYCTPMTKKTCTPARKALARTFKKKAKTGWG